MKKNEISSNYLFNLLYQVIVIMVPLITTPYVSRIIGAEGIGIYSYCLSISTYFILIGTMGIPIYGQREISYNRENDGRRSQLFFEIFALQCIALFIILIVFLLLFVFKRNNYSGMFLMVTIGIVATFFDITWLFAGMEEFKKIVVRSLIIKLASVIMIFTLVKNNGDLYIYALCIMLGNLLGNISLWLHVPKIVKKISIKSLNIKSHIKPSLILLIPSSITTLYVIVDKTLLGILSGSMSEVGYYEQSQKIIIFSTSIITSLGVVLLPRLSFAFANDNKDEINNYLKYVIKFVCFITMPIMFGLMAISDNLVPWFFGSGFNKVVVLIKIFSPLAFIMGLSNIIGTQYLIATKKEKLLTKAILIGTIFNCIFNIILIPFYNSKGAAVATVIGELVILGILMYINRKTISVKNIFFTTIIYMGYSFVMYFVIKLFEKYFISKASISNTFILIAVGGIVYSIILLIRKDEIAFKIIAFVKNKLNSFKPKS